MTGTHPSPVELITESDRLNFAVEKMAEGDAIALDTESNSLHRYPEQLCLIQIATRDAVYIVDPITLSSIEPLRAVLTDSSIVKVIHGADYDIRSLDRHHGFSVRNLYDTSIAARFTGAMQFGLAAMLKEALGVTVPKSKSLQLTDWGRRPFPPGAIDYAVSDVLYLLALKEVLDRRIQELGRTEWVAEECARLEEVRYNRPDPETAYLSTKGSRDLDARGLTVLRSLFAFREKEARRQHRPPFFIIPDAGLVTLAASPSMHLTEVPGLEQGRLQRFGRVLQQAVREGLTAPLVDVPPVKRWERPPPEQVQRLNQLKAWRKGLGESLSLDPPLLWPTPSLERLAKSPDTLDEEVNAPEVRHWQSREFAASLRTQLESLSSTRTNHAKLGR